MGNVLAWENGKKVLRDWTPEDEAAPPYDSADSAVLALVAWIERFIAPLVAGTPASERLAWPTKEAAAAAYQAGTQNPAQAALIEGEAAIAGEDPGDLADLILAKAETYRTAVAAISGMRRKVTAAIEAETDPAQYEVILDTAKSEAVQLATDLGLAEALGVA